MANVKNFGLSGVNADVQFGKGGGRLVFGSSVFQATSDGSTLIELHAAAPTTSDAVGTKGYIDSVASGLDPKQSCQVATTADLAGTYASGGGTGGTGAFTSMDTDTAIDGYTLQVGDRILLKDQTGTAQENGIYIVLTINVATGTIERAADQDGSPSNEVSGGNFTFIENGTANADSGWVLQGSGDILLNTDDLNWSQFSGAGQITAGDGLLKSGNTIDLDFTSGLANTAVATGDIIAFADVSNSNAMESRTLGAIFTDLDVVTTSNSATGFLTQTANDTYTTVDILVSAAGTAGGGLVIANGDGSADVTLGLDILNQTNATVALGDTFLFNDVSDGFVKRDTVEGIIDLVVAATSDNEISLLDTSVVITDTGADGTITFTADANASLTLDDTTAAFLAEITSDGDIQGATLTATGLTSTGVLFNTSGELATEAAFTYNAGTNTLVAENITGVSNIITGAFTTSAGDITATAGNVVAGADVQGLTLTGTGLLDTGMVFSASGELTTDAGFIYVAATDTLSFANWTGTSATVSGDVQGATLTATGLTTTGVVFNSSGELDTEAAFTYNDVSNTLNADNWTGVSGVISGDMEAGTLTATGLTDGRVVFNSSGELTDDPNFLFTTTNDVLTVGIAGTGGFTFDGTNQTITGLATDTDITITPNGTGEVIIGTAGAATLASDAAASMTVEGQTDLFLQSGTGSVFIQDLSTTTAVTTAEFGGATVGDTEWLVFSTGAEGTSATIGTASSGDIKFLMGSTKLLLVDDAANYEALIISTDDDAAIVNKGYVDNAINSGAAEEAIKSSAILLDLTDYSATATGAVAHTGGVPDANQIALLGADVGQGYESAPTFTQVGGTGINAVLTAGIDGSGIITTLTSVDGTGYTGDETWTVDSVTISMTALPAKATILRITLDVTNDSDNASSTLEFGVSGTPAAFAATTDTDPVNDGLYIVDVMSFATGARTPLVTHNTEPSGTAAAAFAILEYRVPLTAELTLE